MSELRQFVIYDHPTDCPDAFVVREWSVSAAGPRPLGAQTAPTLDDARELVPEGLVNVGRTPQDDHKIVEVWT